MIQFPLTWMFEAHMLHKCPFLFISHFTNLAQKILATFFDMCFQASDTCVFDTSAKRTTETQLTIKRNACESGQLFNIHGQKFISSWIGVRRNHVYEMGKRTKLKLTDRLRNAIVMKWVEHVLFRDLIRDWNFAWKYASPFSSTEIQNTEIPISTEILKHLNNRLFKW